MAQRVSVPSTGEEDHLTRSKKKIKSGIGDTEVDVEMMVKEPFGRFEDDNKMDEQAMGGLFDNQIDGGEKPLKAGAAIRAQVGLECVPFKYYGH
ncbi:hypothetical protein O6P43_003133 [Quillaja saponaria]|uniref:Uncharacterized protein n=1 Tax=Quillaja saponaria TaxID=32244 RepID=A0AAD7QDZ5_QUISA|nr:hypothetical protein O6P43_003133 [Quillaja saponaria]